MRASLVLALAMVLCLGCAAESSSFIDASSGQASGGHSGNSGNGGSTGGASGGNSGNGGSTGGTSGGAAGHASGGTIGSGGSSGGTAGHASGGTIGSGGSSGGTAGHASGGTIGSGGSSGGTAGHASGGTAGHASGGAAGHASGGTTGSGGSTGGAAGHASGGTTGTGGTIATGGATGSGGGGWQAGNPNGSCKAGVPARGQPADVSNSTVIGSGTAASCTFAALNTAVSKGGAITFNCGSAPVTIPITATMNLPIDKNTIIDGGEKVTLDGGHAVQILNFNSPDFDANSNGLTLQHLALVNGKTTPTDMIPLAPAPCSQGYDDGEGGALYMRDGNLVVIDCIFSGNQAAQVGPDTGGGAIYLEGSKNGAVIVGSTFTNNSGSNAGAVGALYGELDIYNSLFQDNAATGYGANSDDTTMSMCTVMNNGQYEVGSGGNAGAIGGDGDSFNITLCGDAVLDNAAGSSGFGGGLCFTSDDFMGVLTITDTTMTGNTGGYWTMVSTGSVTNVGTAIGVNAKSITVSNSTLQGL